MAAAPMPAGDEFEGTPCALCSKPITEGQRYYQQNEWTTFGHAPCVEDHLDAWDALNLTRASR